MTCHPPMGAEATPRASELSASVRPASDRLDEVRWVAVRSREEVAEDVVAFLLTPIDEPSLPRWTPGAHIDLLAAPDWVRQYSLCGDPADESTWRIAVLRQPQGRGGSQFFHDALQPGTRLQVRGPRNNFQLMPARRYRFIAGGIGITPILPMIAAASAAGADWELFYGGRRRCSMAFIDELAGNRNRVHVYPEDEVGPLDLNAALGDPRPDTLIYCCGPEALLAAVTQRAATRWPRGNLHLERFVAAAPDNQADTAFRVVFARSGITAMVGPHQSIANVADEAGIPVLTSCEEGVCGTCETRVLAGTPEHRDSVLDDDERQAGDMMMICVSRCRSNDLTLDL